MSLLLEHSRNFVIKAQNKAVKQPTKIEVVYIGDEVNFINDERNQKLNKMDGNKGVKLYYLPF